MVCVLLRIKGAKLICPDFFIEIVESKMIENIILVQQVIEMTRHVDTKVKRGSTPCEHIL